MSMSRSGMIGMITFVLGACGGSAKLPPDDEPSPRHTTNSATSEDWKGQNPASTEELFAGRFPGVMVYRVSGGIKVLIRGASTVNSSTEPLYVIDGMTIEPGPGGALVGLNPADIAKIEVLKDIGSTSMYGVRGGNGVILITTKRATN